MLSSLPEAFCWSKFGAEAGESPDSILSRKEDERTRNGGIFLWGIGNSIAPSLRVLLDSTASPAVIFTPMLSRPASRDVNPPAVARWHSATGLDGNAFNLPKHSTVTSRIDPEGRARRHFALVCHSDVALTNPPQGLMDDSTLRNLRTGSRVGSSQVTSVVKRVSMRSEGPERYPIAIRAHLTYPYLVSLNDYSCNESIPVIGIRGLPGCDADWPRSKNA
jgi:hypothetical protein